MGMAAGQDGATAMIMDIDHFAVHDGPGIRTSIYFKGCPLSCAWCHSPESQSSVQEILYAASRCVRCGSCVSSCPRGLHRLNGTEHLFSREGCVCCGDCVKTCPGGALSLSGTEMTLDQVLKEALADRVFYRNSGGGVTLTGGEVLRQGLFVKRVLDELKRREIHTIVETSGYGTTEVLLALAESATLFYYDYKLGDPRQFKRYIGPNPDLVLNNLECLRKKTPAIVLRVPLVPGITDGEENIRTLYKLARELNLSVIHLLPYNYSAGAKYEWIGRNYSLDYMAGRVQFPEDLLKLDHPGLDVRIIRG